MPGSERQTTADFLTSLTSPAERIVKPGFENMVPRTPDEFAIARLDKLIERLATDRVLLIVVGDLFLKLLVRSAVLPSPICHRAGPDLCDTWVPAFAG
jgi:hypothetical protein